MTVEPSFGLEGRGVVVTGAGGAIGGAVARGFAAAGARVCAVDLRGDAVESLVAELPGGPHRAEAADLRDLAGHEPLLQRALHDLGRLDVLVHAAGVLVRRADVDDVTEADWDLQHDTNLKAAFFLNRAAARLFRDGGQGGRIVNFTSQAWWTGGFGGAVAYAAAKGGLVAMSRGLARSYARDGITVNTVAPGAVDTPMLRGGLSDTEVEAQAAQVPLGRLAAPDELVGAVLFLASAQAGYVTGATLNVSGGWLMY